MTSFLFFDSENCREGVGSSNFILNIFCAAIYIFGSASFNASSSFADSLYPCSFRLTNSLNEPASAAARAILKAGDNFHHSGFQKILAIIYFLFSICLHSSCCFSCSSFFNNSYLQTSFKIIVLALPTSVNTE